MLNYQQNNNDIPKSLTSNISWRKISIPTGSIPFGSSIDGLGLSCLIKSTKSYKFV